MKKLMLNLLVIVAVIFSGVSNNAVAQSVAKSNQKQFVEILYFHGKQRCVTCISIEKLTREVIEKDFSQHLKDGKVVFMVIDISTKEGEKIADKFEVTWSSLFINKWNNGKEVRGNMTDFGFSYAKNSPDVFKSGVKKKIEELLK